MNTEAEYQEEGEEKEETTKNGYNEEETKDQQEEGEKEEEKKRIDKEDEEDREVWEMERTLHPGLVAAWGKDANERHKRRRAAGCSSRVYPLRASSSSPACGLVVSAAAATASSGTG